MSVQQLERRLAALESKQPKSRCGECIDKPCPSDLNCPLVLFDELIQEAERRRQIGDREFACRVVEALGIK